VCLPSGVGRATPHGLPSPLPYLRPRSTGEAGLQGRAAAVYDDGLVEIAHVARPCPLPVPLALVFVSCSVSPRIPTLLLSAWRLACFLCRSPVGRLVGRYLSCSRYIFAMTRPHTRIGTSRVAVKIVATNFFSRRPSEQSKVVTFPGRLVSHQHNKVKIVADQLSRRP